VRVPIVATLTAVVVGTATGLVVPIAIDAVDGPVYTLPAEPDGTPASPGAADVRVRLDVRRFDGSTDVYVPVMVNGRGPYRFVLDTGASSSAISRSLARRLHLPRTGERAEIAGVGGVEDAPIVTVRSWSVGGRALTGRHLPVLRLGGGDEGRIGGLLGADELDDYAVVRLDFVRDQLVLSDFIRG
jgi:predicted aspartyl protease